MTTAHVALRAAIHDALLADGALTAALGGGRVYDEPVVANHWLSWEELQACRARHRSHFVLDSIGQYRAGQRYPLELLHTDPSLYAGA